MISLEHEFPLDAGVIYLDHAAVSPWPSRTGAAIAAFAEENVNSGSLHYPRWLETEARLRHNLAALINAPSPDDIALLKNTSEALSVVAYGLPWEAGESIVISDQEFPSNRIVWESLGRRFGVDVREVDLRCADSPERALMQACDGSTRLLSISSVQYASGLRMDLEPLGDFCHQRDILFCVDAIQSLGALRFDVQAVRADFVMADGHKWMLGPEGVALFYCRAERREMLNLNQFGWHMVASPFDFERRDWEPAPSARRFECGSPNMLGIHGLEASVGLLLEYGMERVEQAVLDNARYLMDRCRSLPGVTLLTPSESVRHAGIVTFRPHNVSTDWLHAQLRHRGVQCALRGGAVRFSPHFYTPRENLDTAMAWVGSLTDVAG